MRRSSKTITSWHKLPLEIKQQIHLSALKDVLDQDDPQLETTTRKMIALFGYEEIRAPLQQAQAILEVCSKELKATDTIKRHIDRRIYEDWYCELKKTEEGEDANRKEEYQHCQTSDAIGIVASILNAR